MAFVVEIFHRMSQNFDLLVALDERLGFHQCHAISMAKKYLTHHHESNIDIYTHTHTGSLLIIESFYNEVRPIAT